MLRTEHVLQADDAGEVVVEVDVVVGVGEPQADQLQELVVELHAFTGTKQQTHKLSDRSQKNSLSYLFDAFVFSYCMENYIFYAFFKFNFHIHLKSNISSISFLILQDIKSVFSSTTISFR